jgi:hypothetical protein
MNEYHHKVQLARLKYPLKKTNLLNPLFIRVTDENGDELPKSIAYNKLELEKFLFRIKLEHENEKLKN